ncbi:MAG: hypothetical protein EBQ97_00690 [Bacteroidetes bacterium]|nr:hypothetical protein [Bacteroidota bacterium]
MHLWIDTGSDLGLGQNTEKPSSFEISNTMLNPLLGVCSGMKYVWVLWISKQRGPKNLGPLCAIIKNF